MPKGFEGGPDQSTSKEQDPKEQAASEIRMIMQECYMMGANDYEIPTLKQLEEDVREGEIDPEEGIKRAREILGSKQDYH